MHATAQIKWHHAQCSRLMWAFCFFSVVMQGCSLHGGPSRRSFMVIFQGMHPSWWSFKMRPSYDGPSRWSFMGPLRCTLHGGPSRRFFMVIFHRHAPFMVVLQWAPSMHGGPSRWSVMVALQGGSVLVRKVQTAETLYSKSSYAIGWLSVTCCVITCSWPMLGLLWNTLQMSRPLI